MKILFLLPAIIITLSLGKATAASITVSPFELEFIFEPETMMVSGELELSCRYEKIVFSDSAEWVISTKKIPLSIKISKVANDRRVRLALKDRQYHEVKGTFRPSKECRADITLTFTDTLYARSNQIIRGKREPIEFKYVESQRYLSGNNHFEAKKLFEDFSHHEIRVQFDDFQTFFHTYLINRHKKLDHTAVSKDPATSLPYKL